MRTRNGQIFRQKREKLLDLIAEKQPSGTILLSGDRHISEFSALQVEGLDYPLYDVTSSGLTHTWSGAQAPDRCR